MTRPAPETMPAAEVNREVAEPDGPTIPLTDVHSGPVEVPARTITHVRGLTPSDGYPQCVGKTHVLCAWYNKRWSYIVEESPKHILDARAFLAAMRAGAANAVQEEKKDQ